MSMGPPPPGNGVTDAERTDGPASPERRRVARLLAIGAALSGLRWAPAPAAPATAAVTPAQQRCFVALCDTLVPADELTPAASALGVPQTILADIADVADARRLLAASCRWLDEGAAGGFAALPAEARERRVGKMAEQPWESPAGRFFQLARNTVMAEYYAQPAAWRGLALDRPPQPLGFPGAVR